MDQLSYVCIDEYCPGDVIVNALYDVYQFIACVILSNGSPCGSISHHDPMPFYRQQTRGRDPVAVDGIFRR